MTNKDNNLAVRYPTEESIDPVDAITELLREAGHPNPTGWEKGLHPNALDKTRDPNERRYLVNRQWFTLLGMLEQDTTGERYCLVNNGTMYGWLVLIKTKIVPLAVQHNLPNLSW